MQPILVQSLIAYLFAPAMIYYCMRVIMKFSAMRGPKAWWAVVAAMYAVVIIFLGLSQGMGAAAKFAELMVLADRQAWIVSIGGGLVSFGLCFWVIIVQYARLRAMLPPPEPGQQEDQGLF